MYYNFIVDAEPTGNMRDQSGPSVRSVIVANDMRRFLDVFGTPAVLRRQCDDVRK